MILVGIAGGTGSGKSTIAKKIQEAFPSGQAVIIEQDAYYCNQSHLSLPERIKTNYDHPNSIEFSLLIDHINQLKNNLPIKKPAYDFTQHTRLAKDEIVKPAKILIVEGILIFAIKQLRELFDIRVFVETDADERLLRRIERDIRDRGRSFSEIKNQYLQTVKPMYLEFVEPNKRYADMIVPRGGENQVAIDMIINKLRKH